MIVVNDQYGNRCPLISYFINLLIWLVVATYMPWFLPAIGDYINNADLNLETIVF